jgi:formylmethanofuran dehydrogenase subunit D
MVQELRDPITGATRTAVLINAGDARRLSVDDGAAVVVRSETGELLGQAQYAPIAPGNLQVHWPEGNVLLSARTRSGESGIPDFNAMVSVERR